MLLTRNQPRTFSWAMMIAPGIAQRLIAAGMVDVIVGVDEVRIGFGVKRWTLADECSCSVEIEEAVDDQHAIVPDDETGIRTRLVLRSIDGRVDAWTDLLENEWKRPRNGSLGVGGRCCSNHRCQQVKGAQEHVP